MSAETDLESEILTAYETSAEEASTSSPDPAAIVEQLAADMAAAIIKYVEAVIEEHLGDAHE